MRIYMSRSPLLARHAEANLVEIAQVDDSKFSLKQADVYEAGPFKRHRAILNLNSVLPGATI